MSDIRRQGGTVVKLTYLRQNAKLEKTKVHPTSDTIVDGFSRDNDCVQVNNNPCDVLIRGLISTVVKFTMNDGSKVKNAGSITSRKSTISKSSCENTGSEKSPTGIILTQQKHIHG